MRLGRQSALERGGDAKQVNAEFDALEKAFKEGGWELYWHQKLKIETPKSYQEHWMEMAAIHARLNQRKEAFGYLRRAMREHPLYFCVMNEPPVQWSRRTIVLRPVKLYLDDVYAIVKILEKHGVTELETLEHPELNYGQFLGAYSAPFAEKTTPLTDLTIRGGANDGQIDLTFGRRETTIHVENRSNPAIRGLEAQVREVIDRCTIPRLLFWQRGIVIPEERSKHPSYFARNRDALIKDTALVILAFVLGMMTNAC
jgi:hypothetical protein